MRRFFRNIPWRNVLIITLTVVLGIGAIAGIASIANKDTKTISATYFKRGAINEKGFYIESDTSIYTKDLIECQGLEIVPDFESTGTYQVFYYDANKEFVGSTKKMDCQIDVVYSKGNNFTFAKYCRVVITPENPKDDYGNVVEDYKIKFYEVAGIANKFTVSVNKEQNFGWKDVYVADESKLGKYYTSSLTQFAEMGSYLPSEIIDLNGYKEIVVVVKNMDQKDAMAQLCLANSDGTIVNTINFDKDVLEEHSGTFSYSLIIPEGISSAVLNGVVGNGYCIYVK